MLKNLKSIMISGKEVFPIIEGGKGVAVTNGMNSGSFARAGAVGTFSGVTPDFYDDNGNMMPVIYKGRTRQERYRELIANSIKGGIDQAQIAHDISNGEGRIHINVLWEMGGAREILEGVLEGAKGLINGVTCGAGMPYALSEIAEKYNVYYYPIVSSVRAFRALWKRSFKNKSALLGGIVYEDPWVAGGHNGITNKENPLEPQSPYHRVADLRSFMNEVKLHEVPIIMAGGVWHLKDWEDWLDNPEIGKIAFQFGTRPLLTKESPISAEWKDKLFTIKEGDVKLNRFSPTGFYSSAVHNKFLEALYQRSTRQVPFSKKQEEETSYLFKPEKQNKSFYIKPEDKDSVESWAKQGYEFVMETPDNSIIFVTGEEIVSIRKEQSDCKGCLSHCNFSNWKDHGEYNTGKKVDPRSFCIQNRLRDISHGESVEDHLMFAGRIAFMFSKDPFYKNKFIPTVKQLVDRIITGE